ncbi:MerR family transcriptional regulator [Nocardia cyriacigeorgica]|uniref:MerR family transcriptional regulator n=1 Tax=Nocardia cyriacigeorgica TaxID=135487 RepID=A0A6P1DE01_9NOCA|nr:MerR family transcriptional regulator [Nocardia cyriacigeorgica]NEW46833.1 MerR family transcriptional regulator [Nocardia cyriacigeorgica]NEW58334.1 MerR family transcriptional regulator [Nocardia cyriacigeorgica]
MHVGQVPLSAASGFPVRVVAERLGIPTATLRSWNQRYGIGPARRPGRHRLYSAADIAQVEQMLALVRAGSSPASAAASIVTMRAVPERGDWERLLTAAFELDTTAMFDLLGAHLDTYGVIDTWDLMCRPTFAEVIARQVSGEGCVDVEHLLSWSITAALHNYAPPAAIADPRSTLLACTSGETHVLALEALRAALAERRVRVRMLGANVPTAAIADTLARPDGPATVVLWSQQESTALLSAIRAAEVAGARVLVGGPGWESAILPPATITLSGLADAVNRIVDDEGR